VKHFDFSPKALKAGLIATIGMFAAFGYLTKEQALAGGVFVHWLLAAYKPQKEKK